MSPTRRSNLTSDRLTHVSSHVGLAACCKRNKQLTKFSGITSDSVTQVNISKLGLNMNVTNCGPAFFARPRSSVPAPRPHSPSAQRRFVLIQAANWLIPADTRVTNHRHPCSIYDLRFTMCSAANAPRKGRFRPSRASFERI